MGELPGKNSIAPGLQHALLAMRFVEPELSLVGCDAKKHRCVRHSKADPRLRDVI
jgi:hypothetical protein